MADFARFHRYYIDDANLELDFFHYDAPMRDAIRAAMRFKGEHNLRRFGVLKGAAAPGATERGGSLERAQFST
jgi:hypothetical protein